MKEVKNIVLYYPICDSNGNVKEVALENDEWAEENIETFYTQTPEMASLTVEVCKGTIEKKGRPPSPQEIIYRKTIRKYFSIDREFYHTIEKKGRPPSPQEIIYRRTIRKFFSVDHDFYELLARHTNFSETFKRRRDMVGIILGRPCQNLLSPAHFYCHIRGCETLVTLGDFSKLQAIKRHWKLHVTRKDVGMETCEQILKTFNHIQTKGGDAWLMGREVDERIRVLNSVPDLKIPSSSSHLFIYPDARLNFRHLLVDDNILQDVVAGDIEALTRVPKPVPIRSCLPTRKRQARGIAGPDSTVVEDADSVDDGPSEEAVDEDFVHGDEQVQSKRNKRSKGALSSSSSEDEEEG